MSTTVIVLGLLLGWMFVSTVIVVSISMMSARISRIEESKEVGFDLTGMPISTGPLVAHRIPTQPQRQVLEQTN